MKPVQLLMVTGLVGILAWRGYRACTLKDQGVSSTSDNPQTELAIERPDIGLNVVLSFVDNPIASPENTVAGDEGAEIGQVDSCDDVIVGGNPSAIDESISEPEIMGLPNGDSITMSRASLVPYTDSEPPSPGHDNDLVVSPTDSPLHRTPVDPVSSFPVDNDSPYFNDRFAPSNFHYDEGSSEPLSPAGSGEEFHTRDRQYDIIDLLSSWPGSSTESENGDAQFLYHGEPVDDDLITSNNQEPFSLTAINVDPSLKQLPPNKMPSNPVIENNTPVHCWSSNPGDLSHRPVPAPMAQNLQSELSGQLSTGNDYQNSKVIAPPTNAHSEFSISTNTMPKVFNTEDAVQEGCHRSQFSRGSSRMESLNLQDNNPVNDGISSSGRIRISLADLFKNGDEIKDEGAVKDKHVIKEDADVKDGGGNKVEGDVKDKDVVKGEDDNNDEEKCGIKRKKDKKKPGVKIDKNRNAKVARLIKKEGWLKKIISSFSTSTDC
uniref:Uncharacterized protein n=1 Tax=Spongospora subterranea TaxID=70186 RepID=A0A0H5QUC7_9EUKA|eukprot:CRZ05613.1 hypothetical protein [Spongospora subterranea]